MNMKKVYKAVAKKYGVSAREVEREISAAIDEIYENPNSAALEMNYKSTMPTPEEFISHIAHRVQRERNIKNQT